MATLENSVCGARRLVTCERSAECGLLEIKKFL